MDREQDFLNQLNEDPTLDAQVEAAAQPEPEAAEEQAQPVQQVAKAPESSKEQNIRILRERAERAERERDEYMRRSMDNERPKQNLNQQAPVVDDVDDFELNIDNDALAEGKHLIQIATELKKVRAELREAKKQSAQVAQQSVQSADEARLKAKYPDAEDVVNKDNLERLKEIDPEAYETIFSSQASFYSKAKTAYKAIRDAGIVPAVEFAPQRPEAQKNLNKPRPINSIQSGKDFNPLSHANAFANTYTPEQDKQLLKEMYEAARNI